MNKLKHISDEHMLLTSRITEGNRNKNRKEKRLAKTQELQLTSHYTLLHILLISMS